MLIFLIEEQVVVPIFDRELRAGPKSLFLLRPSFFIFHSFLITRETAAFGGISLALREWEVSSLGVTDSLCDRQTL